MAHSMLLKKKKGPLVTSTDPLQEREHPTPQEPKSEEVFFQTTNIPPNQNGNTNTEILSACQEANQSHSHFILLLIHSPISIWLRTQST